MPLDTVEKWRRILPEAWTLTFKNLFFPIFCRQCDYPLLTQENGYFCPECWALPTRIERPFCTVCGRPQAARLGFGAVENFPCAACRSADAPPYRSIFGAAAYEGAISEAIKLLKFHDRGGMAHLLAEIMMAFAEREMDCGQYDDLVPVPLHTVRRRTRGFNQAQLLAKGLLPAFPRARLNESLSRIRPTRTQSTIKDHKERRQNVVGAFAVNGEENFDGRTVLLIDDVVTSGGTVSECARALLRAGAVHVDVLAAALPIEDSESRPKEGRREDAQSIWSRFVTR